VILMREGTERVWRAGTSCILRCLASESRGKLRVVRLGSLEIQKKEFVDSREGKEIVVRYEVGRIPDAAMLVA
jgi:hypothetical protein